MLRSAGLAIRLGLFVAVALLSLSASTSYAESYAEQSATPAQKLVVAALNAEWLWTPTDGKVDGSRFNKGDPSIDDYQEELRFYRRLIERFDIDILALSEIENEQVAKEFAQVLSASGKPWAYAYRQGRDTATGQDLAILFKTGVLGNQTDFGFPSGAVKGYAKPKRLSKVLGAKLRLEDDQKLGVITSHFLSKRNDSAKKSAKRLMQARALVKAVNQYDAQVDKLLVLGDFNDVRHSPVIKTLERKGDLRNAQTECVNNPYPESKLRYLIDHILFEGFQCSAFVLIDTEHFSDHPMLVAHLEY